MSSENVLKKLLKGGTEENLLQKYLHPQAVVKKTQKKPGRPKVEASKKARNLTLCLAPAYVAFLDKMNVKDPKVKGRGRKIRFIIDRFIEHERRSLLQLKVLKESLDQAQKILSTFGGRVKKGEKIALASREKAEISKAVDQVHLLLKVLNYSPKSLHRMLPREEWAVLAFCLDWKNNRRVDL